MKLADTARDAKYMETLGRKVIHLARDDARQFNPVAFVRVGTKHEIQDVMDVAAAVCPPVSHFDKRAFSIITAVLLHGLHVRGKGFTLTDAYSAIKDPDIFEVLGQSDVETVRVVVREHANISVHEASGVVANATDALSVFGKPVAAL